MLIAKIEALQNAVDRFAAGGRGSARSVGVEQYQLQYTAFQQWSEQAEAKVIAQSGTETVR